MKSSAVFNSCVLKAKNKYRMMEMHYKITQKIFRKIKGKDKEDKIHLSLTFQIPEDRNDDR